MATYFEPTMQLAIPPAVAGDLIVGRSDGNFDRLAIGANGSVLNVSAGAIRWGNTIDTGGLTISAGAVNLGPGGTTLSGGLTVATGGVTVSGAGNLTLATGTLSLGSSTATTGRINFQNLQGFAWLLSGGGGDVVVRLSATNFIHLDPGLNSAGVQVGVFPAFAAGDKYVIADAVGHLHLSGLGPAS